MTAETAAHVAACKLAASRKLNRWQKLLTAEQARDLPPLYAQEAAGMNAIAHVKYFAGGLTWFATEFDPEAEFDAEDVGGSTVPGMFFGLVISPACPDGELGYFSAAELCSRQVPRMIDVERCGRNAAAFRMIPVVERDIHYKPKPLLAAFREFTGREHPSTATAGKLCGNGCSCDQAATAIDASGQPVCEKHNRDEF